MATTKGQIGSTALTIAAWVAAGYLALKFLPGLIRGIGGGSGTATNVAAGGGGGDYYNNSQPPWYGGQYGQGGIAQAFNGGYSSGLPFAGAGPNGQYTVEQALQVNGLSPDSAQQLAEIFNVQNYVNPDGTPYTPAQQAGLIPQYDDPTAGLFNSPDVLSILPESDYVISSPDDGGDDSGGYDESDSSSGDF